MKKRPLWIITFLLMSLFLTSCTTSAPPAASSAPSAEASAQAADPAASGAPEASSDAGEIKVAFNTQTLQEAVYRDMQKAAEAKAAELGVSMEWQTCDRDANKQIESLNNFITKGFKTIVIEPVDPETSIRLAELCAEAGVTMVDLEAIIKGPNKPAVRVTCDFREIGRAQAREFLKDWGTGPANMVIFCGTLGDDVAAEMYAGYEEVLKENPQITVVYQEWLNNWDRQLAMNAMQNVLAKGTKVDVVITNNDGMGVGAVRAAEEVGKNKDILFYSMDHDEDAVVEILNGVKYKTIDKTSELQGERALLSAYWIETGHELTYDKIVEDIPTWYTPFTIVSADNLEISKVKYPNLFK